MKRWIDDNFNEHLELLKTLAAIPAPSHHEDERAEFVLRFAKGLGFDGAYIDEAKNAIVPIGDTEGGGITAYLAHLDVVFPDTSPLPVREEGGRLYAPGIGDNSADAAAMLTMLRYIKEKGLSAREPVLFVFNSCEEGLGNLKGVRRLMKDFTGRICRVVCFDCSLDGGIVAKAVGSERWRVTCTTRGGHSFSAFGNPNAIRHTAKLIESLYGQDVPKNGDSVTTYNVGTIAGGTSVNTIAQSCGMLYEYRSTDRGCLAAMRESFHSLLRAADCPDAHFEAELIGERPCGGEVDGEALRGLLECCSEAISAETGAVPALTAGSTDANVPLSLGIPAAAFGLFIGRGAHTREEWLDIESLKTGLCVGLRTVLPHFE